MILTEWRKSVVPFTGSAIGANQFMNNAFEEVLSPDHCRQRAVARAPEQRSPPLAGFYAD